jgi:RNA polymerase sigma-70 factor (ECF subfamily)
MAASSHRTVDHLFRHESGKMTAVLTRLLGLQRLQTAQDIVQDCLLQALNTWGYKGVPDNPAAWLHRVARNKAIDFLRREKTFKELRPDYRYLLQSEYTLAPTVNQLFEPDEIHDSLLRMMFVCCHPAIPVSSQIALALKTLCGLSVAEIARAFLKDEETIAKRIYRAKEKIAAEGIQLDMPPHHLMLERLDAVLHCLYLLFNEGYNSSQPDHLIREDLCEEAMRLAYLLSQYPPTNVPRTNALLALFCFQVSRLSSRLDERGNIILMKHQDRTKWFKPLIRQGYFFLETATQKELSLYHLEAAIAYMHAKAPSFEATDWKAIYSLYTILHKAHPNPIVALNKAIAAGYAIDTETSLEELTRIEGLENYYLYYTAIGEAYFEQGDKEKAMKFYSKALALTVSQAEHQLIESKIAACG